MPGGDALFTRLLTIMREALALTLQNVFFIGFVLVLVVLAVTPFLKEIPLHKRNEIVRPKRRASETSSGRRGSASAPFGC